MRALTRLALLFCVAGPVLAQYPQAHAGWRLVPGAERLVDKGYWGSVYQTVDGDQGATVSVMDGTLTATAGDNYYGGTDPLGPWLYTDGDFGLVATVNTGQGMDGLVSLTGSTGTGSQFWQGLSQLIFGVLADGSYAFYYFDGTTNSPTQYHTLKSCERRFACRAVDL